MVAYWWQAAGVMGDQEPQAGSSRRRTFTDMETEAHMEGQSPKEVIYSQLKKLKLETSMQAEASGTFERATQAKTANLSIQRESASEMLNGGRQLEHQRPHKAIIGHGSITLNTTDGTSSNSLTQQSIPQTDSGHRNSEEWIHFDNMDYRDINKLLRELHFERKRRLHQPAGRPSLDEEMYDDL